MMNENSLKDHLILPACWPAWEKPPWVDKSSDSPGEGFPDPVNNPLQLFSAAHLVDVFLSAGPHIIYLEWYVHCHPKCCELLGRTCYGNVKHYFKNKISVASKLLLSIASIGDVSAASVFVCGRYALFITRGWVTLKGAKSGAFVFELLSGQVSCSVEALSVTYLGPLVVPCQEQQ